MNLNQFSLVGSRAGIPVRMPLSYNSLPAPNVPSDRRFREVADVRRSLIQKAGLDPGTYTSLDRGLFEPIEQVFDGLTDHLIGMLTICDAVDLSMRLYTRHEVLLGHVLKAKHHSIPDTLYGDASRAAMDSYRSWQQVTQLTEPMRWLIEICVKYGQPHGVRPGDSKLDYFIVLANMIYMWDVDWEHLLRGVIPYEVHIDEGFDVSARPTDRGNTIQDIYQNKLKPYVAEKHEEWVDDTQRPRKSPTLDQMMAIPEINILDAPLEEERGYSMNDWTRFALGLTDSFGPSKYCRLIKQARLSRFLSNKWDIKPDRVERLLIDHGLSRQLLDDLEMYTLRPMEYARRDSRLLRRPVVVVGSPDKRLCIYGIETLDAYGKMFLERLMSGRVGLPMEDSGPLKSAIGRIQNNLGDAFRDRLADRCNETGYECTKEKNRVAHKPIPQGRDFGPVDVFVIDRKYRRFVLVETKDVADEGLVPKIMKNEHKEFLRNISKLRRQINWFRDRVEALKTEFVLPRDVDYTVEGVIVISSPRLWMYAQTEPLPVVDEYEFFRILDKGGRFQTDPVP